MNLNPSDRKWLRFFERELAGQSFWWLCFGIGLGVLIWGLCGCAAHKSKAPIPTHPEWELVPGHPNYHFGPEHLQCDAQNNCEWVRSWLDKDGKPVLTPLGCWLAKARITWIFGDRPSMCEKKQ